MHKTIHALVLRQVPYKEYDWILTILSPEEGRATVSAGGARKAGSQKAAACQLLCCSRMTVSEYRDRLRLTEAEIIDDFPALREDAEAVSLGLYLCDIAALFMPEQEPAADIYRLILMALTLLSRRKRDPRLVKAVTEFAAMKLSGLAPDLSACTVCGHTAPPLVLHPEEGTLRCPGHQDDDSGGYRPGGLHLGGGVLTALRFIGNAEDGKVFSFALEEGEAAALAEVCEEYLRRHIGKMPPTLDFYKGLKRTNERFNR